MENDNVTAILQLHKRSNLIVYLRVNDNINDIHKIIHIPDDYDNEVIHDR